LERSALLYEMSKMDFVVNFENVGTAQTPSKLIDYFIIKKPILSIKFGDLKKEIIMEFLHGNYVHAINIENPEQYRIERVVHDFLNLIVKD
jgi:bifunctional ADP-heptose synthase (sugar kinase/adenylyltransferase)